MNQQPNPRIVLRNSFLKAAQQPLAVNLVQANTELIDLVQRSATLSKYWRERLPATLVSKGPESIFENLQQLPIMTRVQLQESFTESQVLLPGSTESDYRITSTTGSTGNPARVLKFLPLHVLESDAITLLEWRWFRRDIKNSIVKMKYGQPSVKRVNWGQPLSLLGEPAIGYQVLTDGSDIPHLVKLIQEMNPVYLYSYPSTLTNMAHQLMSTGQKFPAIKQILTSSETLAPWQRELFAQAFGDALVVDRYSSEEFGYIAMQCPRATHLHVIMPSNFLEIVNENNEPCEVGELGRILVTSLHSFAQPLFRYEIGDLARWGEPTGCGINWPILDRVEGRVHEFKLLPDGSRRRVALSNVLFGRNPKLREYKVILFDNAIVAMLSRTEPFTEAELLATKAEIDQRVDLDFPIYLRETSTMPMFKQSKRQVFEIVSASYSNQLSEQEIIVLVESNRKK
jgi:phenylacetate-CoA ligase